MKKRPFDRVIQVLILLSIFSAGMAFSAAAGQKDPAKDQAGQSSPWSAFVDFLTGAASEGETGAQTADDASRDVSDDASDDMSVSWVEEFLGGKVGQASDGTSGSLAEGASKDVAGQTADSASESLAEGASKDAAGQTADSASGSLAEGLSGGTSGQTADGTSGSLAEGLSNSAGSDTQGLPGNASDSSSQSGMVDLLNMTTEEMEALADQLSTPEHALAMDFEWALDYIYYGGTTSGRVITDPGSAVLIKGDAQPLLDGGWKAFLFTAPGVYGSETERYFNVEISTDNGAFTALTNWKYLFDPNMGSSIEESGTDTFVGSFDPDTGTASVQCSYAKIDFDAFYLSSDGSKEYALGTFYWISGERDQIALMR